MRENVELAFHRATALPDAADVCPAWASWYDDQRAELGRIAGADPYAMPERYRRIACAASALSPRVQWETVLAALPKLARGEKPVGFYARSLRLADRAMSGEALGSLFPEKTAPKTNAFAWNLAFHGTKPVVDVWSARAAGIDPERITLARYRACEEAYRRAADAVGLPADRLQALVWGALRSRAIPRPARLVAF